MAAVREVVNEELHYVALFTDGAYTFNAIKEAAFPIPISTTKASPITGTQRLLFKGNCGAFMHKLKVVCLAQGAFGLRTNGGVCGYVPYSRLSSNMTDAVHRLLLNFHLALVINQAFDRCISVS